MSAGHPPPLVFSREFDRFVEVSPDRLVSYPPIGLQPAEDHADAKRYERALGYKKRYTVNNLNLMGHGDVLLLYTDGLIEPLSAYTQDQLALAVSRVKDGTAQVDLRGDRARSPVLRPADRRPHACGHQVPVGRPSIAEDGRYRPASAQVSAPRRDLAGPSLERDLQRVPAARLHAARRVRDHVAAPELRHDSLERGLELAAALR